MSPGDRALVDRFCDMMAAEIGASRNTLLAYRRDLEAAAETVGSLEGAGTAELGRLGEVLIAMSSRRLPRAHASPPPEG